MSMKRNPSEYRAYLKGACEGCGFANKDVGLEVHHADNNPHNNVESNLKTLCPNCHKAIHRRTGKIGRPKGPQTILFRKRLTPEAVNKVKELIASLGKLNSRLDIECSREYVDIVEKCDKLGVDVLKDNNDAIYLEEAKKQVFLDEARNQTKALLDDIERLTKELEEEKAKVKRALEMDLDEKGKLGWRSYFKLKEGGKSEYDQS